MKNDIFRQIVSTASYTLPSSNKYSRIDRTLITTNDLIKKQSDNYYEYAIGIKTGFTTPAKNCLVSSATKDGKTLINCEYDLLQIIRNTNAYQAINFENNMTYIFNNKLEKTVEIENATINIEDEKIQVYNEEITYNLDINGNIIENK